MSNEPVFGWHFTDGDKLRDGRPLPAVGEWLEHDGPVAICRSGLHGSRRLLDALKYAPGHMLHYCEFADVVDEQDDKLVARRRRIVWSMDAEDVMRAFARRVALDVAHLWDMPDVVRQYLETGREDLRDAARDAASAAARAAANAAAWDAARAAASAAAWDAMTAAAWAAASAAAWAIARVAESAAASAADMDAASAKYNGWLTDMVEEAR